MVLIFFTVVHVNDVEPRNTMTGHNLSVKLVFCYKKSVLALSGIKCPLVGNF